MSLSTAFYVRFKEDRTTLKAATFVSLRAAVLAAFAAQLAATGADLATFVLIHRSSVTYEERHVFDDDSLLRARSECADADGAALRLKLVREQGEQPRVRRACAMCGATFSSRNRLFKHMRKSGHSTNDPSAGSERAPSRLAPHAGFDAYYRHVARVADAAVWDAAFAAFQRPVATTIRVHAHSPLAPLATRMLAAWTRPARNAVLRGAAVGDAVLAPGFPRELVAAAQEAGALSRQELNSMLPPLLLGVEPHHAVLDLCCAPGSKTLELLDLLATRDGPGTGLLIANDANRGRLVTAAQRARRQEARRRSLVLTASDARYFSTTKIFVPGMRGARTLRFDRVLADVPCSGDGTMRRSPGGWAAWAVRDGLSLHTKQFAILKRAVEVLKPGGRLLYSTCSLNPVENEAVVLAAIRFFAARPSGPPITLAVVPAPAGAGEPGLTSWRVPHPQFWEIWTSVMRRGGEGEDDSDVAARVAACSFAEFGEVPAALVEKRKGVRLCASMFPGRSGEAGGADAARAQLSGCARALPLDGQEIGGFFCALLERAAVEDAPAVSSALLSPAPAATALVAPAAPEPAAEGGKTIPLDDTNWSAFRSTGSGGKTKSALRFRHQPSHFVFPPLEEMRRAEMGRFWGLAEPLFPLAAVRRTERGDAILVSQLAAQLCQKKRAKMPVLEGGLYLFAPQGGGATPWEPYQEAAVLLAQRAARRVLRCAASADFVRLLDGAAHSRVELETIEGLEGLSSIRGEERSECDGRFEAGGVVVAFALEGSRNAPVAVVGVVQGDGALVVTTPVRLRTALARLLRDL